jgi:hypothetical protein
MKNGNPDTMSANPVDELQGNLGENEMTTLRQIINESTYPWTVADEAIHRGANYAEDNLETVALLRKDEGMTMFAVLKNAYQEGFLHGFEHKFDDHGYEEK